MIEELLTDKNSDERAEIKATEISKLSLEGEFTTEQKGESYTVEIQSLSKVEGGIEVLAKASKDGKSIGFGTDGSVEIERFIFINPPILIPDGTFHTENFEGTDYQVSNYTENPTEAVHQALIETIRIVEKGDANIVAGKVGSTVTTVFPSSDDSIYNNSNATWSAARGATSGTARGAGTEGYVQENDSGAVYTIERYFATLDTSSIPDADTISAATFSVYVLTRGDASLVRTIRLYNSSHSDTVTGTDFDLRGSTLWTSGSIVVVSASLNAYNDLPFDATGIAGINKTGLTKLCLLGNLDAADTDPGDEVADQYLNWSKSNTTGTTQDPKLVVTHAAAPASTGNFFLVMG